MRVVNPWKDTPIETEDNDCHVTVYEYPSGSYAPGSVRLQRWHNPQFYQGVYGNPDPNSPLLDKVGAATYEQEIFIGDDFCGTQAGVVEEVRRFGALW